MKHLVPKTAVTVITAAAALLAVPALASAAPLHAAAAKHSSTVTVSASPQRDVAGTAVKLTASVKTANPAPGGTVTFYWGSKKLCGPAKVASRSAHCYTAFDTAGSFVVRGVYSGDTKHSGSTGKVTVVATKAATSTTVSVSTTVTTAGDSVALNAGVSSHSPLTATGWVQFSSSNGTLCKEPVSRGAAHCSYTWQTPGSYKVTATYLGDGAHSSSHATSSAVTVKAAPLSATTTTITGISPSPVDPGTTSMVTVTVTSATGTPTGTVTVKATGADAGIDSCTSTITLVDGTGSCPVSPAADTFGDITLVATYSGDATHAKSTSPDFTFDVPAPTTTILTFDPTTDTLTATVANPVGNDISPPVGSGTVTFTIGTPTGAAICTAAPLTFTATSGSGATAIGTNTATCPYTPTGGTSVTVYATYSGDGSNEGSTSGPLTVTGGGGGDK